MTVWTWISWARLHAQQIRRHFFRGLCVEPIQLDKLRTRLRQKSQELWGCLDARSEVIPAWWWDRGRLNRGVTHVGQLGA